METHHFTSSFRVSKSRSVIVKVDQKIEFFCFSKFDRFRSKNFDRFERFNTFQTGRFRINPSAFSCQKICDQILRLGFLIPKQGLVLVILFIFLPNVGCLRSKQSIFLSWSKTLIFQESGIPTTICDMVQIREGGQTAYY